MWTSGPRKVVKAPSLQSEHACPPEVCRAPTPTPTQTGLDSTTPNIGAGVAIGRGWSLDGAEFKAYYLVVRQFVLVLYVASSRIRLQL